MFVLVALTSFDLKCLSYNLGFFYLFFIKFDLALQLAIDVTRKIIFIVLCEISNFSIQ